MEKKYSTRITIKFLLYQFLLVFLFLQCISCNERHTSIDRQIIEEIKTFSLPIYPSAKNIEERYYQKYIIKSAIYDVDIYYPAQEVILFYDKEMKRKSFYHFVEDYYREYDRTWQTYIDGTMKGEPNVLSLTTSWIDKIKSKKCTIVLKYFWYNKGDKVINYSKNKKLKVEIYIKPFTLSTRSSGTIDF